MSLVISKSVLGIKLFSGVGQFTVELTLYHAQVDDLHLRVLLISVLFSQSS